jgi:hypothetical protein
MQGLASKSTTTWFLGGCSAVEFIKFHFEVVDTVQLTYTTSSTVNYGLNWYINTAYIMTASDGGTVC